MTKPLFQLGDFQFDLPNGVPQKLEWDANYRWEEQGRLLRDPAQQFVGPGSQQITLDGVLYPGFSGKQNTLEDLRKIAVKGEPLMFTDGLGKVYGQWAIKQLKESKGTFAEGGNAREIGFNILLVYYAPDKPAPAASPLAVVPSPAGLEGALAAAVPGGLAGALGAVLPGGLAGALGAVIPGGLTGALGAVLPGGLTGALGSVLPGGIGGVLGNVLPGGLAGAVTSGLNTFIGGGSPFQALEAATGSALGAVTQQAKGAGFNLGQIANIAKAVGNKDYVGAALGSFGLAGISVPQNNAWAQLGVNGAKMAQAFAQGKGPAATSIGIEALRQASPSVLQQLAGSAAPGLRNMVDAAATLGPMLNVDPKITNAVKQAVQS